MVVRLICIIWERERMRGEGEKKGEMEGRREERRDGGKDMEGREGKERKEGEF